MFKNPTRVPLIILALLTSSGAYNDQLKNSKDSNRHENYVVYSDVCKIPETPLTSEAIREAIPEADNFTCSVFPPLTKIIYHKSTGKRLLYIDRRMRKRYIVCPTDCCYQQIRRSYGRRLPWSFSLNQCQNFEKAAILGPEVESVIVKCKKRSNGMQIYANVHTLVAEKMFVRKRLEQFKKEKPKPISVLILGIDSVSRKNFYRTMNETAKHVQATGWFEMAGYNKVNENTFPNLMSLLAGLNISPSDHSRGPNCNITKYLDGCPLIWKKFQQVGYVTAYAEDAVQYSTFTYNRSGFLHPPTDYYLRPTLLAARYTLKRDSSRLQGMCTGHRPTVQVVFDYALDFTSHYLDDPFFGFFWVNSLSHDSPDQPQLLDNIMLRFLRELKAQGVFNRSVVFFLSDHGSRFGKFRLLDVAHLEARLPFCFLWLPPSFRAAHPKFVAALKTNKHRLTSPFDIHMTLRHILELSGRIQLEKTAIDCEKCQSLFETIPLDRSCEDANISDHWCACREIQYDLKIDSKQNRLYAKAIENHVSHLVKNDPLGSHCEHFRVAKVGKIHKKVFMSEASNMIITHFLILFQNQRGLHFEAVLRQDMKSSKVTLLHIVLLEPNATASFCVSGYSPIFIFCNCKK